MKAYSLFSFSDNNSFYCQQECCTLFNDMLLIENPIPNGLNLKKVLMKEIWMSLLKAYNREHVNYIGVQIPGLDDRPSSRVKLSGAFLLPEVRSL